MAMTTIQRVLGEVEAWPPGLADQLPEGPWTVAHVKPRQEKLFASNLRRLGLAGVLFLERRVRTYPHKGTQQSTVPLLPGYVFIVADPAAYEAIYATDRVVRLITVREPAGLRSDLSDLVALVTRADTQLVVRPELVPGATVEMRVGSLAGLRGVIARRKGRTELVVNVRMLGTSVAVACAAADVDAA